MSIPTVVDTGVRGINIELRIKPQNINTRLRILSAKKPKIGCNNDENILEILITTVAIAIVIHNFAAIKGIIGLRIPVYTSLTKCPAESHRIARLFLFILINS